MDKSLSTQLGLNKQWTNPFQYVMIMRRMKQILSDPAEFGKAVLESKKRDHCIQNLLTSLG